MVSSWKRVFIATFVSLMGCAATYWWHLKNEPKFLGDSEADVVAYLSKTKKEIHRKGAQNTLWEPAEELDRLRAGDSVRTSGNSEVRIQFYRSNRYIDLESESMIVIQKQESEISLELLEGSLFVNGVDSKDNKAQLTLKAQGGKVDLSKSAVQLSGSSTSNMDLKILKGSAQLIKNNGATEAIPEGREGGLSASGLKITPEKVKIISPDIIKPFYVNAAFPEPVIIEWSGFPENAQVFIEGGSSRNKLSPLSAERMPGNKLKLQWKPGTYYWKLKANNSNNQQSLGESKIFKTEVVGRYPPTPVSPEPNFVIHTRKTMENITLRWNTPEDYTDVLVELQNNNTKQKIFNKRMPSSDDSASIQNLPLGSYSWRMTAYPKDGTKELIGPAHNFFINEKVIAKIPITWNSNLNSIQYFVNTEPKLTLMWNPDDTERVNKWKVRIVPEGSDLQKAEAIDTLQIKLEKILPKAGRYQAYIEAFDEEGDSIGTSEVRLFLVDVLPLLSAPTLLPDDETEFLAKPDGSLGLRWNGVDGTKNYQVTVFDSEGNTLNEFSSEGTVYKLNNLMPGNYLLQVNSIDNFGRKGALGAKRKILVPDKSEVKAPKLKTIKVN